MTAPERVFRRRDLPALPAERTAGIYMLARHRDGSRSVYQPGVLRDGDGGLPRDVDAVAVAGATCSTTDRALALAFADHLRVIRSRRNEPAGPWIASAHRGPFPFARPLVRVLHVLTTEVEGQVEDRALWEWCHPGRRPAWAASQRSMLDRFHTEEHLQVLLAVRSAVRRGRLVDTPESRDLLLALSGRYLSGRFLAEHHELLWRIVTHPHTCLETL